MSNRVGDLLSELPALSGFKLPLTDMFVAVMGGVSLDVLLEQKQSQDELRGFLRGIADTYLTTGLQRRDMENAIAKATSTLEGMMKNFMTPDTFTKVGSNIESYPADIEQIASMVNSAFRVVPQDDLDRPQVRFYIYYTELLFTTKRTWFHIFFIIY